MPSLRHVVALSILPLTLGAAPVTPTGLWRAEGYGQVLAVTGDRSVLYHVAGPYCYPDPNADAAQAILAQEVTTLGPDRIAFSDGPGQTRYVYRRIATLPATCRTTRRWSGGDITRLVAATFADLYPRTSVRERHRRQLGARLATIPVDTASTDLFDRLADALDTLDDAHVSLSATIDGQERSIESGEAPTLRAVRHDPASGADPAARERAWNDRYRNGITGLLAGGGHLVAHRRILWGRIGRIGYINVLTMGGFAEAGGDDLPVLDAALDAALADFRDLPGVIVDVSNNRGGYDSIGLRIAGRFAARAAGAYAKAPVGSTAWQPFRVEPSPRIRYTGPVALLTSDITVSAGDTFTLAMRALPNVRHVGARTRGALSDQLVKPLPNGWTMTLPAETYRAANGRYYEGSGIPPADPVAPFLPDHTTVLARLAARMAAAASPIS
ncbi:S41 family peptidase [uncultured Sphingomonas sp.]|uniref:S41 family peptidase n=1 Tax=uncultured Sphingomonas sp. TaxID=158754 RepID=UPI0025CD4AD8|nr:S41 family peptidase [uncultured Sphingomonas sp.]